MSAPYGRLLLASLAMLALAACGDSEATRPAARVDPAPRPVAVASGVVQDRSLAQVLDVTGTLAADAHTDVATEKDGRVVQVLVERGMVVESGAVLARLDQTEAVTQLREAEATEAQTRARLGLREGQPFDPGETPEARRARAMLERAEAEYQRYARLVEKGIVSRSSTMRGARTPWRPARSSRRRSTRQASSTRRSRPRARGSSWPGRSWPT